MKRRHCVDCGVALARRALASETRCFRCDMLRVIAREVAQQILDAARANKGDQ